MLYRKYSDDLCDLGDSVSQGIPEYYIVLICGSYSVLGFSKSQNCINSHCKIIEHVDVLTFKVTGNDRARDRHHKYFMDKELDCF